MKTSLEQAVCGNVSALGIDEEAVVGWDCELACCFVEIVAQYFVSRVECVFAGWALAYLSLPCFLFVVELIMHIPATFSLDQMERITVIARQNASIGIR